MTPRMRLVFMALLVALVVGQMLMGSPQPMSMRDVWDAITR